MPVYNGASFLNVSIESILNQTLKDFEFLIINDGSTDNSVQIIDSYSDPRIRLINNPANAGWVKVLNQGMGLAKGDYIVRMDCDDVSLPGRLEKQVDFMDQHPEIGISGTWYTTFGGQFRTVRNPTDPKFLKCILFFGNPLGHPTVIMRRESMDRYGLNYDATYPHSEDYELWSRAIMHFELSNLPQITLRYRIHPHQVTNQYSEHMNESALLVRRNHLKTLEITPNEADLELHHLICSMQCLPDEDFLERADAWLCRIYQGNKIQNVFPEPYFSKVLLQRWLKLCNKSASIPLIAKNLSSARIIKAIHGAHLIIVSCMINTILDSLRDQIERVFSTQGIKQ